VALLAVVASLWATNRQLNAELAQAQAAQSAALALPTATATPAIGVVLLPGGHQPPVAGRPPEPGEAGGIPAHLLPVVNAYVPPPIPTPSPEQARRLEIPALSGDYPIVQGDDWEQLKKGIGQYAGSGQPGRPGNVVLSGHNDIYGEPFRYLDRLVVGDEIIVSTERQAYTYVVSEVRVVEPTEVWVMGPTEHAQVTLISCYPYRVDTRRIVVFARLADEATGG
jgi:sortase A